MLQKSANGLGVRMGIKRYNSTNWVQNSGIKKNYVIFCKEMIQYIAMQDRLVVWCYVIISNFVFKIQEKVVLSLVST